MSVSQRGALWRLVWAPQTPRRLQQLVMNSNKPLCPCRETWFRRSCHCHPPASGWSRSSGCVPSLKTIALGHAKAQVGQVSHQLKKFNDHCFSLSLSLPCWPDFHSLSCNTWVSPKIQMDTLRYCILNKPEAAKIIKHHFCCRSCSETLKALGPEVCNESRPYCLSFSYFIFLLKIPLFLTAK